LSVLGKVVELSLVQAVLSMYTLFFGLVVIMLEGQGSLYPLKVSHHPRTVQCSIFCVLSFLSCSPPNTAAS
jgi:hypothetical protein